MPHTHPYHFYVIAGDQHVGTLFFHANSYGDTTSRLYLSSDHTHESDAHALSAAKAVASSTLSFGICDLQNGTCVATADPLAELDEDGDGEADSEDSDDDGDDIPDELEVIDGDFGGTSSLPLMINNVQPGAGATNVDPAIVIRVSFNQSVNSLFQINSPVQLFF